MNLVEWLCRPSNTFWIALAILLPVMIVNVVRDEWLSRPPKPVGDGLEYENIAYHLYQGRGYVIDTADPDWRAIYVRDSNRYSAHLGRATRNLFATGRPPLFPTLVAGIYCAVGRNEIAFTAVRLLAAICLAVSCAIAAVLTSLLLRDRRTTFDGSFNQFAVLFGIVATVGLAATHRTLRSYANDFLTEPLALLLAQLFLLTMLAYASNPIEAERSDETEHCFGKIRGRIWLAVAGVILGTMILTRSVFVAWLPGIWIVCLLTIPGSLYRRVIHATCLLFIAAACCVPWWTRNVIVLDRFMPLGTQGAITLLGGYSDAAPGAAGDWQSAPEQQLRRTLLNNRVFAASNDTAREVMVSKAAGLKVRQWITSHVADLPSMFLRRIVTHWNPYNGRSLVWKLLIVAGVIGLLRCGNVYRVWLIGMPLISTCVAAGLYTTGGRFLVPMYGILFTIAGLGVYFILASLSAIISRKPSRR